ncbi:MAG: hypothetical protein Q9193_007151 [Seirophora villosa]
MSFLGNPKVIYGTRIAQLLLGIAFLVLVCYSGTHRAWWTSVNGPLAVGVIASIFTFAVTIYSIFTYHRSNPFSGGSATITIARLAAEVVVFLLWVASAALMLRPRGGCENKHKRIDGNTVFCWNDAWEDGKRYDNQPIRTWDTAIAISLIEAWVLQHQARGLHAGRCADMAASVSFIATVVLVWLDDRKSKVSGGTSYA